MIGRWIFLFYSLVPFCLFGEPVVKEFAVDGQVVSVEVAVRKVTDFTYDSSGNKIHSKDSEGNQYWWKYDSKGNLIYEKDFLGVEIWYKYNLQGNLIYKRDSAGEEERYTYDGDGKLLHAEDSYGEEEWFRYDEDGNLVHAEDSYGIEERYEYDSRGRLVSYSMKPSSGVGSVEEFYKYDDEDNMVYCFHNGEEVWFDYDEAGNKIHEKWNYGAEFWWEYEYDSMGRAVKATEYGGLDE